jgi:exopolysaccharide production protein ExoZ
LIYSMQYLRGLAALLVIVRHAAFKGTQYAGDPMPWYRLGGVAGVELFFIISGFIMCYTTIEKAGNKGSVGPFLTNRFTRILPLYWILTFLALIIFFLIPDKVNIGGGETKILYSFLLIPTAGVYLMKNGWTLSYEFFFYFIFSLGMLFPKRLGHLVTSVILFALVCLNLLDYKNSVFLSFISSTLLLDFILGILLFELFSRYKNVPKIISGIFILIGLGLLVLLNHRFNSGLPVLSTGIACFFLSMGFVFLEEQIKRYEVPFFTMVGDASYSLYLFHPFVLAGGALILSRLGLCKGLWAWPFLIFLAAISLAGGILCYLYLEKPITKQIRALVRKKLFQGS